jgi:hypothetical protein
MDREGSQLAFVPGRSNLSFGEVQHMHMFATTNRDARSTQARHHRCGERPEAASPESVQKPSRGEVVIVVTAA